MPVTWLSRTAIPGKNPLPLDKSISPSKPDGKRSRIRSTNSMKTVGGWWFEGISGNGVPSWRKQHIGLGSQSKRNMPNFKTPDTWAYMVPSSIRHPPRKRVKGKREDTWPHGERRTGGKSISHYANGGKAGSWADLGLRRCRSGSLSSWSWDPQNDRGCRRYHTRRPPLLQKKVFLRSNVKS